MRRGTTTEWMAGSLIVGLSIVLLARLVEGPGDRVGVALQATARWSFVLFWLGYTGHALAALFAPRFHALAQRTRDFGLAFASAHLAHLALVAWVLMTAAEPTPRSTLILFGVGVFCTYLLALLSIRSLAARLDPKLLRVLRTVGVDYIALLFLIDFAKSPSQNDIVDLLIYSFIYLPFILLAVAGPLLRLAALVKRVSGTRRLAA
jgi:hypothetical protein